MTNEFWIAGAGSGKTSKIIDDSIDHIEAGGRVLVVTFTTNNQAELRSRFIKKYGKDSSHFIVKGIYSFYLEDMVRPYQSAIFSQRIESVFFSSQNPHHDPATGRTKVGRGEKINNEFNPLHYLTKCKTKAHTGLLAKLACRVSDLSSNAASKRLKAIYSRIYFDEVQDLIGWDYSVLQLLAREMPASICCVGDFRQTIYDTAFGHKLPQTSLEKIDFFTNTLKFVQRSLPLNRRCIQSICDIADSIHAGDYDKSLSDVKDVPAKFRAHQGAYSVKLSDVPEYIATFSPTVLRWSIATGKRYLPPGTSCYNFGTSKGLGFDRVLIIPSPSQKGFLLGGIPAFAGDKTDEAQNKLYVGVTRARYSLGFVIEDDLADKLGYPIWQKAEE